MVTIVRTNPAGVNLLATGWVSPLTVDCSDLAKFSRDQLRLPPGGSGGDDAISHRWPQPT